jgi:cell division protein FtsI/penicillin-binding protein 2
MRERVPRPVSGEAQGTRRSESAARLRFLRVVFGLGMLIIVGRLFILQVVSAGFYRTLAEHQHSLFEELFPRRGKIVVRDFGSAEEYPVATIAPRGLVYAVPADITDPEGTALKVAGALGWPEVEDYKTSKLVADLIGAGKAEEALALQATMQTDGGRVKSLVERLSKAGDPYEPVERSVDDVHLALLDALKLPGIHYVPEDGRAYPEPGFGGQVLGFVSTTEGGEQVGNYGLEGYFNEFLTGKPGTLQGLRDTQGGLIGLGQRDLVPAVDGGSLLLTIDRTVQVVACDMLQRGVEKHAADSGALVILDPKTGAIIAMCGVPDFLPAEFGQIKDYDTYNNQAIFTPYEPGSIFKPLTVAAGIDTGAITPYSLYNDTGSVQADDRILSNAEKKVHGTVDMVTALEESINTAMVFIMRQTGAERFTEYVEAFGFGKLSGIELNTEVPGTIEALYKGVDVYRATASFGQGITTTPLQMAVAYGALANEGALMKPYVVAEKRFPDGTVEATAPTFVRQVISPDTAKKVAAMMVSVVEEGHGKRAGVPGYYIAGKTGTAQIAENGVYSATKFNGSFAGFGPIDDPRFVMVVKVSNPKSGVIYAESTAAPIFGDIAAFLVQYYAIPPGRVLQ